MRELLYVDTSIAAAMGFEEPGWRQLAERSDSARSAGVEPVSSAFLLIEMRRVFFRAGRAASDVDAAVTWLDTIPLDPEVLMRAGDFRLHIGTLDVMHLAVAQSLVSPTTKVTVWSLDQQMNRAAAQLGLL